MRDTQAPSALLADAVRCSAGVPAPAPAIPALLAAVLLTLTACGDQQEQVTLPSAQVGMDHGLEPLYDDGELTLYEVRRGVPLPILAPTEGELAALETAPIDPYPRTPWVTLKNVRVQLSWTLTNLDDEPHVVEVLVDPWNEFGRYFPGLQLTDAENQEYLPNLSGIDYYYPLDARSSGEGSRRHGVYTFDDMDEMARDLGTVMNLLVNRPPPLNGADPDSDPTVTYANHAFAFQNHSDRDPLVRKWVPGVVPALTGFDIGLRTTERAKIAIEVVAEVLDLGANKLKTESNNGPLFEQPDVIITVGSAAP